MLVLDVLRWITVRALMGNTWAGSRVFDSPSQPADMRAETEREPFIAIYVDDADLVFLPEGGGMVAPEPFMIRLVIEVGVVSPRAFGEEQGEAPGGGTVTSLNATDEGLEAQIGFITRQVQQTLLTTKSTNEWAELWRVLTGGQIHRLEIRRGGQGDEDRGPRPRFASRVSTYHLSTLADPVRGVVLDADELEYEFWRDFLDLCEREDEMQGLGEIVRAHLESPSGALPEWRMAQKYLGVSRETIRALGIAPAEGWRKSFEPEVIVGEDEGIMEEPPLLTDVIPHDPEPPFPVPHVERGGEGVEEEIEDGA